MTLFSKGPPDDSEGGARFAEEGLAYRMNDIINTATSPNGSIAMKAGIVGFRSETDNAIFKQMKEENDRIDLMFKKLAQKETYYYNLFARMEMSMSKANNQMSYLASITGGGQ